MKHKGCNYIDWVRGQPCVVGLNCYGRVHAHHVKSKGAGGKDDQCLSLCAKHHYEYHQIGKKTFAKKYNLDYEYLLRVFKRVYNQENSLDSKEK